VEVVDINDDDVLRWCSANRPGTKEMTCPGKEKKLGIGNNLKEIGRAPAVYTSTSMTSLLVVTISL
jgi:hypothetical protein